MICTQVTLKVVTPKVKTQSKKAIEHIYKDN